ncbi:hypothetical protein [Clostridium cadaveris]|uniref:hypothetical protein n=1 Tax=Clostridium cadaveris TaxID=1529 RepID=UPI000C07B049|nr:hypothetical protein [Clostridium cadaveris]
MKRKPSIFSREYERKMKRRKVGIISLIVIVVLILGFLVFGDYAKPFIKDKIGFISAKINKGEEKNKETAKDIVEDEKTPDSEEKENITDKAPEEKEMSYDVTVSDGVTVKALYDEKDGTKSFKFIEPGSNKVSFDINKSSQQMLLLDESSQKMVLQDINGSTKDITLETYVSSSGTQFLRTNILGTNPGYVWTKSPKFIDDTHIVYISQLPWFNKEGRYYVWILDVTTNSHSNINGLEGASITIGALEDNGINIDIDGNKFILNSNGSATKVN